jgi:hypothetical protein
MTKKGIASLFFLGLLCSVVSPRVAEALQTITMYGNYIITGSLIVNGLSTGIGHCVGIGTNGLLLDSGAACGGSSTPAQAAQVTTSATTPFQGTFTFGTPYSTPPICVATGFSATPLAVVATIVSESTTAVTIYDSSHTGAIYNVQCTHS